PPTAPAPAPSRRYQSAGYRVKTLLLGPALKTSQLSHQRVSKRVALAVFSSDPISSTAYATEEILLVLVGATLAGGVLATGLALPVALAIVALLALLVVSYRQVVHAYPAARGGLRGQPGQLRQRPRRRCRGRPADRLRADRGRQRVQRRGRHGLGLAGPAGPDPGRAPGGLRGPARLGQPARHPRGRQDLRHPHLRVRGLGRGHDRGRDLAAGQRR